MSKQSFKFLVSIAVVALFLLFLFPFSSFFDSHASSVIQAAPTETVVEQLKLLPAVEQPEQTVSTPALAAVKDALDHYKLPQKNNEWCDNLFGFKFLENIVETTHYPYCDPALSHGSMECFYSPNPDGSANQICLAQQVHYSPSESPETFQLHCALNNWTDAEHPGFQPMSEFREYFFDTGPSVQLRSWQLDTRARTCAQSDNKITLLIKREGNMNVWHTLMHLWSASLSLDALRMIINPSTGLAYVPSLDNVQIVITDDSSPEPVYPLWGSLTGKEPIKLKDVQPGCLGTVILPLAGSGNPFWESHWEPSDCRESVLLDAFVNKAFKHLDVTPWTPTNEEIRVTIIDRKHTRVITGLSSFLDVLQQRNPKVQFNLVALETLSLREQMELMQHTDVLVGVIGAGLTNLMWLRDESALVELLHPEFNYHGFRNLAKMKQMNYFTAHGEKPPADDPNDWQQSNVYLKEEVFVRVIETAIASQHHRGLLYEDVSV